MDALLTQDWTVEQTLLTYPQTADVFIRFKVDCVGCRLEKFCTLEEVVRDYNLILDDFLAALQEAILATNPKE
jgi:hybrid cluster-associated redox disulfide protein